MRLLDSTQWRKAIAEAVQTSYSDIFTFKAKPGKADKQAIQGKYKTTYNVNDLSAERATNTFLALLDLSDQVAFSAGAVSPPTPSPQTDANAREEGLIQSVTPRTSSQNTNSKVELCYNIQIHLPPTKDVEVYNAIFKSLREHFVD